MFVDPSVASRERQRPVDSQCRPNGVFTPKKIPAKLPNESTFREVRGVMTPLRDRLLAAANVFTLVLPFLGFVAVSVARDAVGVARKVSTRAAIERSPEIGVYTGGVPQFDEISEANDGA
jgi:hypothetical protein